MSDTKDNILKVDGVADIVMEVAKIRAERDVTQDYFTATMERLLENTELSYDKKSLRVKNNDEFNFLIKFLIPNDYQRRVEILQAKEKEANNE